MVVETYTFAPLDKEKYIRFVRVADREGNCSTLSL